MSFRYAEVGQCATFNHVTIRMKECNCDLVKPVEIPDGLDEMGVAIMDAPNFLTMLFVRTDDVGAERIDIGQGTQSWVVMADPEGNEFCVLRRRVPPEPEPFGSHDLE